MGSPIRRTKSLQMHSRNPSLTSRPMVCFPAVTLMKRTWFALVIAAVIGVLSARSEVWVHTNLPSASFAGMSANGAVVVATGFRGTFVSFDYGATWQTNNFTGAALAMSASGSNIFVGASPGIYTSTNAGASWSTQSVGSVRMLASSADGARVTALLYGSAPIMTSPDVGVTWSTNNNSPLTFWGGLASSGDGNRLAAAGANVGVWLSADAGVSWSLALASNVTTVASSVDGRTLMAAQAHVVYVSTDFGATWSSQEVGNLDATSSACSADGTRLGLASYSGIYISTNSGTTWELSNQQALAWDSVACSADGHRWWASRGGGGGLFSGMSPPAPVLKIDETNGNVKLSWIVPSSPYVLQQRPFVDGSVWSVVAVTPSMNTSTLCDEVSVPSMSASGFFRLANP
jgi:hypothetical protein